jgi:uncharacterized membrane protein
MQKSNLFKVFLFIAFTTASVIACKHEPLLPGVNTTGTGTTGTTTGTGTGTTTGTTTGSLVDNSGWKCSPDSVYFNKEVLPILVSTCAMSGCHDAVTKADGYQLTDYVTTMKKGISAGKATSSKVYTEMSSNSMPPRNSGITLTQAQKDIVAKWINQGAKNLTCNASFGTCDTANVKFATFISPIVQNKCLGCHNAVNPGGNVRLDSYAAIKTSVQSGKFWGSIAYAAGVSKMPKGIDQLPQCELNKIQAWIKAGAQNN